MTAKLVSAACNFKINGFLWYQGENEDQQDTWASRYFVKFKPLRDTVRSLSKNPNLPVIAVQLESWDGGGKYALAQDRWPRWPVIRDQQELIGAADAFSATVSAIDAKGLHVEAADQTKIGRRAAAAAAAIGFGSDTGYGPRFTKAWFTDGTRSKIVVQFRNVKGKLVIPDDKDHLGFFIMQPKLFSINDSAIFRYGANAKMLKNIAAVTALDGDKALIELETAPAAAESLTVGYGRHINLITLNPLTDATGIPVTAFFNRPIDAPVGIGGNGAAGAAPAADYGLSISPRVSGREAVITFYLVRPVPVRLDIIAFDGRRLRTSVNSPLSTGSHAVRVTTVSLPQGAYLCRMAAGDREKTVPFYIMH
jgi:hypothetical protein